MSRELHPVLSPARRQELVREGVALFHGGRYFEAHEAWEEVWRSTTPEPRDLYQGLVQLAAAFHHLHARQRPDVARRVLAKAQRRLATLLEAAGAPRSSFAGARDERGTSRDFARDLRALLALLAEWDRWLAAAQGEPPPLPRLDWLPGESASADQPDDSARRAT